jgi:hypothetical protein
VYLRWKGEMFRNVNGFFKIQPKLLKDNRVDIIYPSFISLDGMFKSREDILQIKRIEFLNSEYLLCVIFLSKYFGAAET